MSLIRNEHLRTESHDIVACLVFFLIKSIFYFYIKIKFVNQLYRSNFCFTVSNKQVMQANIAVACEMALHVFCTNRYILFLSIVHDRNRGVD